MTIGNQQARDPFDRVRTGLDGLPGVKFTRPTTIVESLPIVEAMTTYVVESARQDDGGVVAFVQIVDAEGRARLVFPDKVVEAIVGQRSRLYDRSTPASRARKAKARDLDRKRRGDHGKGRHAKRPVGACPLCT